MLSTSPKTNLSNLKEMVKIAKKYDLILCHENEKEIFGDKIERIKIIKDNVEGLEYIFDPSNFIQVDEDIDKYYNNELNFYKEGALIL